MEVHQLRYFLAVAEEGSFSRAAERARVAQPSLSQQIQKLEAEIGQPLFDRLKRKVSLTEAGVGLLPFARRILNELADAQHFVADAKNEPSGVVKVGIIATIAPYMVGKLLQGCARKFPKITLKVVEDVTENLVRATDDGEIDVAVISTCRGGPGMHIEPCAHEGMALAVAKEHRLAKKKVATWLDLRGESILMLHESHCLSRQIRLWCTARKLRTDEDTEALQVATLLAMVAAGRGVCFLPEMAVEHEKAAGCAFVELRGKPPEREINLLRNVSRYQSRAVAAFCAVAREEICHVTRASG
jgi:LysR family transcriptional regulator, hydrogen peroxide-inducible genes activator